MPEVKDVQAAAPAQEVVQPAAPETPAPQASGEKAGGEGQAEDD